MRVAVLIACHNRRVQTLRCLHALAAQQAPADLALETWLVDDGSTDGTAEAVREADPAAHVIPGDGNLFWCGAMRLAWRHAAATSPDAFLWLNDDVVLDPHALVNMLAAAPRMDSVVVGSCRDPESGRHTYGGQRKTGRHPAKLAPVPPAATPQECDTFEGNLVLVPGAVYQVVGTMQPYRHAMADTDYGLTTRKAGLRCVVAAGHLGRCPRNPGDAMWRDRTLPSRERLRVLASTKGLPPRDWLRFCTRHGGLLAPCYFLSPYLRVLLGR